MEDMPLDQELHHEIFGSILDRTEMTPFLLLPARDYATALKQATRMMANRGFDTLGGDELGESERERASHYIRRAYATIFNGLFPFVMQAVGTACRPAVFERRTLPHLPARSHRGASGAAGPFIQADRGGRSPPPLSSRLLPEISPRLFRVSGTIA